MKHRLWLIAAIVGLALAGGGQLRSGEKQPDFKELIEKYGTPGPEHKLLEPLAGKWEASCKAYMEPGKDPAVSKGGCERKWLLDGRYLQESFEGQFMGAPFKGIGTTGYDRYKKKFVFTWIDSMGTGITLAEGTYDDKNKSFTYAYTFDCPIMGKDTKARDVVKIISDNEHTFEMYRTMAKGPGEMKVMEITYKRAAK